MSETQLFKEQTIGTMPYPLLAGQAASLEQLAHVATGIRMLAELSARSTPTCREVVGAVAEWLVTGPEGAEESRGSKPPKPEIGLLEIEWQLYPLLGRLANVAMVNRNKPGAAKLGREVLLLASYAEVNAAPKKLREQAAESRRGKAARRVLETAFFGESSR